MAGLAVGSRTLVGALSEALHDATSFNRSEMVPPAVVLWPDKERQWEKLMPLLRHQMAHLLTLGPFDSDTRTGPAIWIKCASARKLEDPSFAAEAVPIIYLPGVSRAELRAVEDCPPQLQPLAELQYRGVWFTQPSAKDWTVLSFLCSNETIGLDVARDGATLDALHHTLLELARTPLEQFEGRTVTHDVLNTLVHSDPARSILHWLDEPNEMRERNPDQWAAFRAICRKGYAFDPEDDGRLAAAEKLGAAQGNWAQVWSRFVEAPHSYVRIPDLLTQAQPAFADSLFFNRSSWPKENEEEEASLRRDLAALLDTPLVDAFETVQRLERTHGERRAWVWASLDMAPLAEALRHLSELASVAATKLPSATIEELAQAYRERGWEADSAAMNALAAATSLSDEQAVRSAVRSLYVPWLETHAGRLQELVRAGAVPTSAAVPGSLDVGTCYLFVDGMRYDVGQMIAAAMRTRGWLWQESWRWAALPTVTATAKPASSPVADLVAGTTTDVAFNPCVRETGETLTADRFRRLLDQRGIAYLPRSDVGDPTGIAWTEIGDLDRCGHEEGARLARRIAETVDDVVERLAELFDAGWKRLQLVTDHGWLLVPGGLPKVHIPNTLTSSRWGRCAALKDTSHVDMPTVPWSWNSEVRVALAPGIGVYLDGREYAHGGLTLQEAIIPEFLVSRPSSATVDARLASVEWVNLRCKVQVAGDFAGTRLDIRTKPNDAKTSVVTPKEIPDHGAVSVLVADDELNQCAAVVVVLDSGGRVVSKQATTIGG